ncbi:MAG: Spy/CpxP family protein refolding chaperone [Sandaracinaceae bacterium]|nr:Spy/CpxP family protein refolding chaperone [Sandaracinaceae bacterium]
MWPSRRGSARCWGSAPPLLASAQDDGGVAAERRGHGRAGMGRHGRGHHGPGHHGRGMAHRFGRMADELGLSEAQREQVRTVMARVRDEHRAARDLPPEERRAAMQQARERVRGQLEQILTPAQRARAEALRVQHGAERIDRRIEHMTERLGLTPAQQGRIRGILERAQAERLRILAGNAAGEAGARPSTRCAPGRAPRCAGR